MNFPGELGSRNAIRSTRGRGPAGCYGSLGFQSDFPLLGSRSLSGATKLAAELLIEEYKAMYGGRTFACQWYGAVHNAADP